MLSGGPPRGVDWPLRLALDHARHNDAAMLARFITAPTMTAAAAMARKPERRGCFANMFMSLRLLSGGLALQSIFLAALIDAFYAGAQRDNDHCDTDHRVAPGCRTS